MVRDPPADAGDARDTSPIPGWGRPPGGGHGSPLQCSGLENPMDRGGWPAAVRGVAESDTAALTNTHAHVGLGDQLFQ